MRLILLLALLIPATGLAQGWATFRNCTDGGAVAGPRPEQPAGEGCQQAEFPEDGESGFPMLVCRSEHHPNKPDLIARVYSSRTGQRAYIYADGRYQKTVLTFPGVACLSGTGIPQYIDVTEYVFDRQRQQPALIELQCADGEINLFKIQR